MKFLFGDRRFLAAGCEELQFRHFLNISKGSAGEVKSMYYIAEDQKYVDSETAADRRNKARKLINGNGSFMKYLKSGK
ncbi:MAG: four helix bundle protein [Bacteroidetes bacterium]|nr:MAG: four helix bundle protein [Bacteroidota bacterium]